MQADSTPFVISAHKRVPFLARRTCQWIFLITGLISDQTWYGPSGMEHVRTRKEPKQSIPTFAETVALLMRVSL
jgi:hypothetical protein